VKLRCSGVQPDDNPVKSELVSYFYSANYAFEPNPGCLLCLIFFIFYFYFYFLYFQDRVELYQDKLERLLDLNKGIYIFFL